MPISEGDRSNFETILSAAQRGDLTLLECVDTASGETHRVLCAVNRHAKEFEFVPLAKLFHRDPYAELEPPR